MAARKKTKKKTARRGKKAALNVVVGSKVKEAIIDAGKTRLRPIILTTVTTSVGLFPIILEKSHQAQFLIPMAISLAYGVAVGTFFILVFFPVLIHVLNDVTVLLIEATDTRVTFKDNVLAPLRLLRAATDHTDLVETG